LGKSLFNTAQFPISSNKIKELIDAGRLTKYQILPSYASVFGIANRNNH
jgi:hypothetical protein